MNGERFDELTRALATSEFSRLRFLQSLAASTVGALFGGTFGGAWMGTSAPPAAAQTVNYLGCAAIEPGTRRDTPNLQIRANRGDQRHIVFDRQFEPALEAIANCARNTTNANNPNGVIV